MIVYGRASPILQTKARDLKVFRHESQVTRDSVVYQFTFHNNGTRAVTMMGPEQIVLSHSEGGSSQNNQRSAGSLFGNWFVA